MIVTGLPSVALPDPINPIKWVTGKITGNAIDSLANSIGEALGQALTAVGTMWVRIGTPDLTSGAGSGSSTTPPGAASVSPILDWVAWGGLAIAVGSLMVLGGTMAMRARYGHGWTSLGQMGVILLAAVVISATSSMVGFLIGQGPKSGGGTAGFLQSHLWYYVLFLAVLSVLVGAAKMAWTQRAEAGVDVLKGIITLVVVAGCGLTATALVVEATDAFSVWILNESLKCDIGGDGGCFGTRMTQLFVGVSATGGGLGAFAIIVLGAIALLGSYIQMFLMLVRGGLLVILAGILPLTAAMSTTEMGRSWFKKNIGWLVAFVLYKPAAAIVYATAFQLAGTDIWKDSDATKGIISVLTGLVMMIVSLVALPALMRFTIPAVAATGQGGAAMGAAMGALPTGAIGGKMMWDSMQGGDAATGGSGAASAPGGDDGPPPAKSSPPPSEAPSAAETGAASSGAGAGGGAAGGGAAAAGTAATGAATGGAMLVAEAVEDGLQAGANAAKGLADDAAGE